MKETKKRKKEKSTLTTIFTYPRYKKHVHHPILSKKNLLYLREISINIRTKESFIVKSETTFKTNKENKQKNTQPFLRHSKL